MLLTQIFTELLNNILLYTTKKPHGKSSASKFRFSPKKFAFDSVSKNSKVTFTLDVNKQSKKLVHS